jgi:phosphohistidine phosphatase
VAYYTKKMKKLTLFRHAKSSWKYPIDDISRPLNGRGLRQASSMALSCTLDEPDAIISSPASRAYATALVYLYEHRIPVEKLTLRSEIYAADSQQLLDVLKALPESVQHVWLFGHNPGLNDLASFLLNKPVDNIVTSAYVTLAIEEKTWAELDVSSGQFIHFNRP